MDEYKRLYRVFLRKQAERREIWDMLQAIPRPKGSAPNPDRIKLQEKILRLDGEISGMDWKLVRLDPELAPRTEQGFTDREPVATTAAATAGKKIANPARYPTLNLEETRDLVGGKSRSTIYRWLDEGRLERASLGRERGKRGSVLILTLSVAKILQKDSE